MPYTTITEPGVVTSVETEEEIKVVITETPVVVDVEEPAPIQVSTPEIGLQGATGIQGPIGPQGLSGDLNYKHVQGVPSTTWNVIHNLNKRPSVTVVDSGGTQVEGSVTYISNNNLTITFSAPFGGDAYIN